MKNPLRAPFPAADRAIPFFFFIALIIPGLTPLNTWVRVGDWIAPLEGLREKTLILFGWLRLFLPVAGIAGLVWIFLPAGFRARSRAAVESLLSSRWTLPAAIAINIALSLWWIRAFPNQLYADSIWYFEHAAWMSEGYGYVYDLTRLNPTAAYPVGYPLFLSLVFRLTGPSLLAAKLFNVLLLAGSVALTGLIGEKLFGKAIGALAALLLALSPGLIVYTSLVNSDLLFLFLSLVVWLRILSGPAGLREALITGLILGAASLVRSTGLMMVPFWMVVGWFCRAPADGDRQSGRVRFAAGLVLGAMLVIAPWTLRNYAAFGKLIPGSNNGGINLWMGSNPRAYGSFVGLFYEGSPFTPLIGDEIAFDETAARLGRAYFAEHPGRVLSLLPAKVFYLLNSTDAGVEWNFSSGLEHPQFGSGPRTFAAVNFIYTLEMLLALLGFACLLRIGPRRWETWLGAVFLGYWILLHLPFFGKDRFMMPVLPFLLMYAAAGLLSTMSASDETSAS